MISKRKRREWVGKSQGIKNGLREYKGNQGVSKDEKKKVRLEGLE